MSNILKLVPKDAAPLQGESAKKRIAQFLREQADAIENDEPDSAEKCVVIVYATPEDNSSLFRLYSRFCNVSGVIERAGLVQLASADICDAS